MVWLASARIARTGWPIRDLEPVPAVVHTRIHEAKRILTLPVTSRLGTDRAGECAVECLKNLFMENAPSASYYLDELKGLITGGWAPYEKDRNDITRIVTILLKRENRFGETAIRLAHYFAHRAWMEDRFTLLRVAEECARIMYIIQATSLPWWGRFTQEENDILHFVEETRRNIERSRAHGRWIHVFNDVRPAPLSEKTRLEERQREIDFEHTIRKGYDALDRTVAENDMDGITEAETYILEARALAPLGGWWGHNRNRLARLVKLYQETETLSRIELDWQNEIDQMIDED